MTSSLVQLDLRINCHIGSSGQNNPATIEGLTKSCHLPISRAPRFRRLDNDYLNLQLLKLDDLYKLSIYKFMHQYHNRKLPDHFLNFFLEIRSLRQYIHQTNVNNFRPIRCNKKIYGTLHQIHRTKALESCL